MITVFNRKELLITFFLSISLLRCFHPVAPHCLIQQDEIINN